MTVVKLIGFLLLGWGVDLWPVVWDEQEEEEMLDILDNDSRDVVQ